MTIEKIAAEYPDTELYIGGAWQSGAGQMEVVAPATGEVIGHCAVAATRDLDNAVAAALRGFRIWSATPGHDRAVVLRRAADVLDARARSVGGHISIEQGKPLEEAEAEVRFSAEVLRWNAGEAERIYGRVIPSRQPGERLMVLPEPIGPVLALTPWNFPIYQPVAKIAPALAAGCSVVVKPSEETPAGAAALTRALHDAGLPPGALNMVFGNPEEISSYLISSPIIRKVSFTGSVAVGRLIATKAGQALKKATLELGGHAPVIVCPDADPEQTARLSAEQKFRNAGQVCVSASRFIVHRSILARFTQAFVEATKARTIGPLINARRVVAVEELVRDAVRSGANLVAGAEKGTTPGYYFPPAVLSNVPPGARIMQEEPFGPVAAICAYGDLDQALEIANSLPFGLAAYAFTDSSDTAERLINGLEAGIVLINTFGAVYPETPFGGVKDSGFGSENGIEGVEGYLRPKYAALTRASLATSL
ncbi:succinate-semialdehyde dehydrogenase/glutarate-semialdehyde dehydrogenase [Mesorhizobium robiniae]|uniref:Succinate-semialdehyde dehydrogenase/glutarate-semialdehyde dehydrogenase n=1 Tax=Mesorhizobium robiniae TaxID=559315 RepID=A0ABV2H065_9HYPH|nr:NAD-dependent succinate-semialdehyde dehydrogenase [Mesorhizobium sp. ZC-5]MCV3244052.1 NAD-dependent succinate-semialdehyde dehydrogenase [Mesorhizobium sp. ZC-5]